MPRMIGEDLLAHDEHGRPRVRIATVFPKTETIVTLPGAHATHRIAYVDAINRERAQNGLPPLTCDQEETEWMNAVDLIIDDDAILIRPDPENMPLAFAADELLQQITSKKRVRFLHVLDHQVREAIKKRGECWRISLLPRSPDEMKRMICGSKIAIGGRDIYYYNKSSGTRLLTCQQFQSLIALPEGELRQHLLEIQEFSQRSNRQGNPEVAFFEAGNGAMAKAFSKCHFADLNCESLGAMYESLQRTLYDATPAPFRQDDPDNPQWRSRMYGALIGQSDKSVSEEALLGLSAEFFMQVEWLPGGRVEDGELMLDPVFEEEDIPQCKDRICDETARGLIFNLVRDCGDLEYVNIGRVKGSLSGRRSADGRRGVYVAEFKQRGGTNEMLRIIRMQKWSVGEHLDEGKDLLSAILEAEEYTEYIFDRRMGCRQLGMNLFPRASARKIMEKYGGRNYRYHGTPVWAHYFERDYISGLATDKIPSCRFQEELFAIPLARLLGRAAAPNLILGRCELSGDVVFDDGDELVIENERGVPIEIIVADHTGTFVDYQRDLFRSAPAYARCAARRARQTKNPQAFLDAFLLAFEERFTQIQRDYRRRRRGFNTLFKHKPRDERGSFAYRWELILKRLDETNVKELVETMRSHAIA